MLLFEFSNKSTSEYQDVDQDNSKPKFDEVRKVRLTLAAINKIRRMNEVQSYERAQTLKKIRAQYAPPVQTSGL